MSAARLFSPPLPAALDLHSQKPPTSDVADMGSTSPRSPDPVHLPRSASYTYFPPVKDNVFEDPKVVGLRGTISEEELSTAADVGHDIESDSPTSSPEAEASPLEMSRRPTLISRTSSSKRVSRFLGLQKSKDDDEGRDGASSKGTSGTKSPPRVSIDGEKRKTVSRSRSRLRRKSLLGGSRGGSPDTSSRSRAGSEDRSKGGTEDKSVEKEKKSEDSGKGWLLSAGRRRSFILGGPSKDKENEKSETDVQSNGGNVSQRRGKTLKKSIQRPSSVLVKGTFPGEVAPTIPRSASPRAPPVPPLPILPKSFSTDKLPSLSPTLVGEQFSPSDRVPHLPRQPSYDKLKASGHLKPEVPKKKDELWNVFRTLDADFQKFQSKSIALKANVVRSTIIPFVRSYGSHTSNQRLRAEDLDRRTNIMNKWWTGLLEMLAGRNNQSISGTDRPAILEAIVGIMERPEWRLRPSPFSPMGNECTMISGIQSKSTTSLASNNSDFLGESVQHNVRNIFTQNLLSQIAFVVDKMSLRNAPASLVSFCGKTCAYAFFFCPGIADMLVRLWEPSPDVMRRVIEENGLSRHDKMERTSNLVLSSFPPNLQTLKITSFRQVCQELRKPCQLPLGVMNLDWHGPWIKRWAGAESDLFYVFVKYYHVLVNEFLPSDSTEQERLCAPGLLMVHTQLLTNLDATVHRVANSAVPEDLHTAAAITFDDVLGGDPDASAAPLPIAPANATRLMAENRLIMLLRDYLSERSVKISTARKMFAESFMQVLKACAKKVSMYDHSASYTLCDFLEEAIPIIVRYEQINKHEVLDWPFWIQACRKMVDSENTATEIRLYSFLYTIWGVVCSDTTRKRETCINFMLEERFFEGRFNHWCPMIRSYFMRILCWRVARFDGEARDDDIAILEKLLEELRRVHTHYLFLKENAESHNTLPPSTIPCPPAPGRRLLIIRTDAPLTNPNGHFLSFDGVVNAPQPAHKTLEAMDSIAPPVTETIEPRPESAASNASSDYGMGLADTGKKRWSVLRSLISPITTRSKSRSPGPKEKPQPTPSPPSSGTSTPKASITPSSTSASVAQTAKNVPTHRSFCFKFSLEWGDKRFQYLNSMRLSQPRLPQPAQEKLRTHGKLLSALQGVRPSGPAANTSRYAGRSLAEWSMVVNECQNFFERRKNEGVPANKWVETPSLGVESFKKPG